MPARNVPEGGIIESDAFGNHVWLSADGSICTWRDDDPTFADDLAAEALGIELSDDDALPGADIMDRVRPHVTGTTHAGRADVEGAVALARLMGRDEAEVAAVRAAAERRSR